MNIWFYDSTELPFDLRAPLEELRSMFSLENTPSKDGKRIRFQRIDGDGIGASCNVVFEEDGQGATVEYTCVAAALRGLGNAMAGIAGAQSTPFAMLGIMIDLSRNMVLTVEAMERLLKRLAFLGFNTIFLYCEDTYELPDEPYFGMMRGRYSAEEIRRIDQIAQHLGIQCIGCIQTLGHLSQPLRWNREYHDIADTSSVLMVDEPKVKCLIGKMLDFWGENLKSRRIHVGMDETFGLGRGQYMNKNGYVPDADLYTRHLAMVSDECAARGLHPMIWSDMLVTLSNSTRNYYDTSTVIPPETAAKIPDGVQLVYWDYYHHEPEVYEKMIDIHRAAGKEPLMAAGIYIWSRLWLDWQLNRRTNRACLEACRRKGLREIFFTMWGDDGAICHFDSILTGLVEASGMAYGMEDDALFARHYKALTGADFDMDRLPGRLTWYDGIYENCTSMAALYDDLLIGLAWHNMMVQDPKMPETVIAEFKAVRDGLAGHRNERKGANLEYGFLLADFLLAKLLARKKLVEAYNAKDTEALAQIKEQDVPSLIEKFDLLAAEFRRQWLDNAKPFGMETIQHRLGGQRERLVEAARRLGDYLAGTIDAIPELEEPYGPHLEQMVLYRDMASPSVIS